MGLLGRQQILEQYAQHLSAEELHQLASLTSGCSGRDLRDLCEQAERHWAAKVHLPSFSLLSHQATIKMSSVGLSSLNAIMPAQHLECCPGISRAELLTYTLL